MTSTDTYRVYRNRVGGWVVADYDPTLYPRDFLNNFEGYSTWGHAQERADRLNKVISAARA